MRATFKALVTLLGIAGGMLGTTPASAFLVDFDGVANSSNSSVQTYLNNLLGPGFVTVWGAVATQTYNGDGFVNRVPSGTYANQYMTLGYTNGATSPTDYAAPYTHLHSTQLVDKFITNVGNGPQSPHTAWGSNGDDKIVFIFRDPIYSLSFDWEIFPNGSCNQCAPGSAAYPDFSLRVGMQGSNSYVTYGPSLFPVSAPNGYPQGLGHFSTTFATGVTRIEFVDWPVKIGIDNLDPTRVPEPGALSLIGLALAALFASARRRVRLG
jgi:hypothetical protein